MLKIHEEGKGVAGTYAHEIAEQKAIETTAQARSKGILKLYNRESPN